MQIDTDIGGLGADFPSTSWSLVRSATDRSTPQGRERFNRLLSTYWKPVYRFIRARWGRSNEDAKDLTQGFFALMLEGDYLASLAPEYGTFRGYLKSALTHFLVDEQRKAEALKRGGAAPHVAVDLSALGESIPDAAADKPDAAFDREWVATCLAEGVRRLEQSLKAEGREPYFRVFQAYYLQPGGADLGPQPTLEPTHESIAEKLGLKAHDVSNHLVYARRKLKLLLRDSVRDYVATEADAAEELKFLLGE